MNIDKLIADILPPNNYEHRNGFSNIHIIDSLNTNERTLVEEILINKLLEKTDILIVETLAYMKSLRSLPVLINLLNECSDDMCKIIISTSVFELNHDNEMIPICTDAFKKLSNDFERISAFYYLRQFRSEATNAIIKDYTKHSDYLLSYNAKQALNK